MRVALLVYDLLGYGTQRQALTVARALARRGLRVDLVIVSCGGTLDARLQDSVRLTVLGPDSPEGTGPRRSRDVGMLLSIPALARYLRRERPDVLLSMANHIHPTAVAGHLLARSQAALVAVVTNPATHAAAREKRVRKWLMRQLSRVFHARVDHFVVVASGLIENLRQAAGIPASRCTVIHPVVDPDLERKAAAPLEHPWFQPGQPPVIVGVGRLVRQKDFPTLLRAFARIRAQRPVRLVIVGGGKTPRNRERLLAQARRLGVEADVALTGFVDNPLPYIRRAAVFALSSAWEGLPCVLIEALGCGCPIVSTDCLGGGAREVLADGAYGPLVPVGDDRQLADAIVQTLQHPPDPERLRERAAHFRVDRIADAYVRIVEQVALRGHGRPAGSSRDGVPMADLQLP